MSKSYHKEIDKEYKPLRKHFNNQGVGFPKTKSGIEFKILRTIYKVEDVPFLLALTDRDETIDVIHNRFIKLKDVDKSITKEQLLERYAQISKSGGIRMFTINDQMHYSIAPFLIGMYEYSMWRFNEDWIETIDGYMDEKFAIEYLSTNVPQMRTIPINEAIEDTRGIADYDKVRGMIQKCAGPFMIGPCVCKIGKDIQKDPCKVTDRRDVCMAVGPMAEMFLREGWGGREISKEEALEIQALNEKEGLIMQVENNAEPEFFCGCCECCCGPLHMGQYLPRSIDFIKNNVHAEVNQELCNSCSVCTKICPMGATTIPKEFDENELLSKNGKPKARINLNKCIGCGLCVPKCSNKAIHLVKNEVEVVPPNDRDDMMDKIREGKRGPIKQKLRLLKAIKGKPI